ncbi:SOS response-associated peptidase family protein [Coleofasciculus sp. LEGE 07092]|uniref:SOS response-associated peptidase family protein n=1 Tax=Coleofasciculus sp. LEGE 07092 TaxID=2777969 RepID=UPI0018824608|nr:SOS response-associated peptidase family protein [Coleofasciculus sp. LEGE 07092]MBE9125467.1 SOS response-associated peptidase family protein [Coleofasciculus sp. LEGE 07081]
MPLLNSRINLWLDPQDYDVWLDLEVKAVEVLQPLLRPYPSEKMMASPVSTVVNKASHDSVSCIESIQKLTISA